MKARVKGTTAIIDVTFDKNALNVGYPPYKAGGGIYYYPEQLVWIDDVDGAEPDYWEKLKHQYAGMAMQGILANCNHQLWERETNSEGIAKRSHEIATTLVNKLKEEEICQVK